MIHLFEPNDGNQIICAGSYRQRGFANGRGASGGAILDLTHQSANRRVTLELSLVPKGQQSFSGMSVEESLWLGAGLRARSHGAVEKAVVPMYDLFPKLAERRDQMAGRL